MPVEIIQNVSLASAVIQLMLSRPMIQLFFAASSMSSTLRLGLLSPAEFGSVALRKYLLVVDFPASDAPQTLTIG